MGIPIHGNGCDPNVSHSNSVSKNCGLNKTLCLIEIYQGAVGETNIPQALVELLRQNESNVFAWIDLPGAEIQGNLLHNTKPFHMVWVQVRENEVIDLLYLRAV